MFNYRRTCALFSVRVVAYQLFGIDSASLMGSARLGVAQQSLVVFDTIFWVPWHHSLVSISVGGLKWVSIKWELGYPGTY